MHNSIKKIALGFVLLIAIIIIESLPAFNQQRYELRDVPLNLILKSQEIMLTQVGKTEIGNNRGIADEYNKSVGNPIGSPYCQAGQFYCYKEACSILGYGLHIIPIPRNGMANSTFDYIKRLGTKTNYKPRIHDFIIWRSPEKYTGHIERIISIGKAGWVTTVGFNTSSGNYNSQDNGDGVWERKRNIYHPLGRKRIRGLAGVGN